LLEQRARDGGATLRNFAKVIGAEFRLSDAPPAWDFDGRCGFATDFEYSSGG